MKEYTQIKISKYLGIWKYTDGKAIKYYSVLAKDGGFEVRWGRDIKELDTNNRIFIKDSDECYRRILSKARAGYVLDMESLSMYWNSQCSDEFNSIEEVLAVEKEEYSKRKPRKRKLSLLEWVSGANEIRENE